MSLFDIKTIRFRYIKVYIDKYVMILRILSLEHSILNESGKLKIWNIMKNDISYNFSGGHLVCNRPSLLKFVHKWNYLYNLALQQTKSMVGMPSFIHSCICTDKLYYSHFVTCYKQSLITQNIYHIKQAILKPCINSKMFHHNNQSF